MAFESITAFFSNPLLIYFFGAGSGIIWTLITKFGEAFIQEIFEQRKKKSAAKVVAGNDIMSFCLEGMSHGFRKPAGDEHHIRYRANQIEAIDENTGKKLNEFAVSWSMHQNIISRVSSLESDKTALQYRDESQQLGSELLVMAKKWIK